jgi:carbonic anhydrase/acetyltransferase-like protein (isoleucine patch superfamily)
MLEPYQDFLPRLADDAFVHDGAFVIGDVELGARVTVWPATVLRGDQGSIRVGDDSNLQDGSVVHCTGGRSTTRVGARVTVGHRAILHGCTVEDDCLVGMGSVILDSALIGRGSVVGAGAVVLVGTRIPENSLVVGTPARRVRETTRADHEWIRHSWETYVRLGTEYRAARRG